MTHRRVPPVDFEDPNEKAVHIYEDHQRTSMWRRPNGQQEPGARAAKSEPSATWRTPWAVHDPSELPVYWLLRWLPLGCYSR